MPGRPSVAEVARPGHEHRAAGGVDGGNDLGVAHRAAGLDERGRRRPRGRPRPRRRTGRTRPTRRRRPQGGRARIGRALSTAPRAASTRDVWPEPIPISRRVADEHDRVRGHAADQAPGKVEVEAARRRSGRGGWRRSRSPGRRRRCRARRRGRRRRPCGSSPSGRRPRAGPSPPRAGSTHEAQVRLGRQDRERRRRRTPGATTTSRKIETSALGDRRVDRPGERDHAAEGRHRVAGQRRLPRLEERRPFRGAARVRVLDDDAGRPAQRAAERRGRRRVEDVVVRERLALERRLAGRERAVRRRYSPGAGSGPPAGAGSRRSAASRPSRARSSGVGGYGIVGGREQARLDAAGPGARPRCARRTPPCGRTPRAPARAAGRRRARPRRSSAARTAGYRSGDVTIATLAWFLAAARTIDGPPMSISSISSSMVMPGRSSGRRERVQVDDDELERRDRRRRAAAWRWSASRAVGQEPAVDRAGAGS